MLTPILITYTNVASLASMEHGREFLFFSLEKKNLMIEMSLNRQRRPPPLEVTLNDTLVIHTYNSLDKPTALHAHGMFQNGTGYMDGPTMVTQW